MVVENDGVFLRLNLSIVSFCDFWYKMKYTTTAASFYYFFFA